MMKYFRQNRPRCLIFKPREPYDTRKVFDVRPRCIATLKKIIILRRSICHLENYKKFNKDA